MSLDTEHDGVNTFFTGNKKTSAEEKNSEDKKAEDKKTWLNSTSKHIYFISEIDVRNNVSNEIGYCRTRAEADHLIYDIGIKRFNEHKKYREEKKKYKVFSSYKVFDESTTFEIKEKSLGYIYDGPNVNRYIIKFTKLFRSYNSLLSPGELENIKKNNEDKD